MNTVTEVAANAVAVSNDAERGRTMSEVKEAEKTGNVANSAATALLDCFVDDQGLQIDGDSLCPGLYWCRIDSTVYHALLRSTRLRAVCQSRTRIAKR